MIQKKEVIKTTETFEKEEKLCDFGWHFFSSLVLGMFFLLLIEWTHKCHGHGCC